MSDLKARLQAEADSFRAASVKLEGDSHAADLLTQALSRITELEEKQGLTASQGMADRESTGWRTIDSAPRDGTPILATSIHHGAREVVCWQDGVPSGSQFGDVDYQPEEGWVNDGPLKDRFYANPHWFTHWQPLPAAPVLPRIAHPQDDQASSSLDAGRNGGGAS